MPAAGTNELNVWRADRLAKQQSVRNDKLRHPSTSHVRDAAKVLLAHVVEDTVEAL